MHNSLHIRNRLSSANRAPLYTARRDPHRLVERDPAATCPPDCIEIGAVAPDESPANDAAGLAAEDLADFFKHMEVKADPAGTCLRTALQDELEPREFRIRTDKRGIAVNGGDEAGLWAGIAWIEREMRRRRGPFAPRGEIRRKAAWKTQISQGPWGGNYSVPDFSPEFLSDDSFRLYAHYGVNAMMIYGDLLLYAKGNALPELKCSDAERHLEILREAAERALRYGVRFAWCPVGPKLGADHPVFKAHPEVKGSGIPARGTGRMLHFLCSSQPRVLDFYEETFGAVFEHVPQLAGLICIVGGESFYHCKIWSKSTEKCPRCAGLDTEEILAGLTGSVARGAQRGRGDAFVAAWPYNTLRGDFERPDFLESIRRLPESVAYFDQIDRDQWIGKEHHQKHIWDYSIDYTGPCDNVVARARTARETGHEVYLKTETGIGLEVFQYPYVPAMQRLADKWETVRQLEPAGVHQSWLFFGMFGSRAEELGLWAAYAPDIDREEWLRQMAERDFGPDAAEHVIQAWTHVSAAMGRIPCIAFGSYYLGPVFLGPAHPFLPSPGDDIPETFHAALLFLQEGEESLSPLMGETWVPLAVNGTGEDPQKFFRIRVPEGEDVLAVLETEYRAAAGEMGAALEQMRSAAPLARTKADRQNAREELLLTEAIFRTFETCANFLDWLAAREEYEETHSEEAHSVLRKIAERERENALEARGIYAQAPWLDLSNRLDGTFHSNEEMIEAKIDILDQFLGTKSSSAQERGT